MDKSAVVLGVVVAILSSNGLFALIQWWIANRHTKETIQDKALKALLHDRIYDECYKILKRKTLTIDELENLKYLYEPYKALGGNGTCQYMMNEVEKLPVDTEGGRQINE